MGVLALDNFVGANGSLLTAHTADTGQAWQVRGGAGFSVVTLQGNRARANSSQATFTAVAGLPTNYSVEAVVNRWQNGLPDAGGALGAGLMVRGGIANVYYEAHYYEQGATRQYRIAKNNNAYTVISTVNIAQWIAGDPTRKMKLKVSGTNLIFYVDDVVIFNVTDATLPGPGLPGFRSFGATGTGSFEYEYLLVSSGGGMLPKLGQTTIPLDPFFLEPEDDMICRQALEQIWATYTTAANEKVWAYQIRRDYCADWLFLSPGLLVDPAATDKTINTGLGIRVYEEVGFDNDTWKTNATASTKTGKRRPVWTQPAWYGGYIPWSGRPVNIIVEFYTNGGITAAANSILEFSLATYKDTNLG